MLDQEVGPEEYVVPEAAVEVAAVEPDHHGLAGLFVQYRGVDVQIKAILVANRILLYHAEERTTGTVVGCVVGSFPGFGRLGHLEYSELALGMSTRATIVADLVIVASFPPLAGRHSRLVYERNNRRRKLTWNLSAPILGFA